MNLNIDRSVQIQASTEKVYGILADLKQWDIWSPWIHCEPTAKTQLNGTANQIGQTQTWNGEVIGSGKMTVERLEGKQLVGIKTEFFTPWKSVAHTVFTIKALGSGQCEVNWKMESPLPIFMIFFKKMMTAYIGSDFDRGLRMLKEYAETGKVVSKQTYKGENNFSGFQVVGKRTACRIDEMPSKMESDFQEIGKSIQNGQMAKPEFVLSLYHKYDIPKGTCEYEAACAYKPGQDLKVPTGYVKTPITDHRGLLVDFFGPYRNLGNPWSMIVSYQRGKKKKVLKKIPMYEIYRTMPDGRPENELHTQIIMPIK